jgi:hypothetical protein
MRKDTPGVVIKFKIEYSTRRRYIIVEFFAVRIYDSYINQPLDPSRFPHPIETFSYAAMAVWLLSFRETAAKIRYSSSMRSVAVGLFRVFPPLSLLLLVHCVSLCWWFHFVESFPVANPIPSSLPLTFTRPHAHKRNYSRVCVCMSPEV